MSGVCVGLEGWGERETGCVWGWIGGQEGEWGACGIGVGYVWDRWARGRVGCGNVGGVGRGFRGV